MAINQPTSARNAPTLAWTLGFAALIPFLIGSYVALGWNSNIAIRTLDWLVVYAAVIASFIGGVQWGLQAAGQHARAIDMGAAVCPALIVWIGVMLGQPWSFALILVALVFTWLTDENGHRQGWMPIYYLTLRRILTPIVVVCLAIVGGAALFG
ncbi:DUF3429 domain-containing protein [Salinisphaera sp. USBA-960]|uniref:DUF3429 domain-containing protein n=1 Tax=Salinisphaera orenii TaxID=856731 RepID=UPI000DBE5181|nr:DUF3429 domain-containing protein [Salifodinibacter halophilus]NNC26651.1 DUF3429 domain-containing protein [Salifodinibacter halophilus]